MRLRNFPGVTQRVDGKARIYLCTYLIHFMHTGLKSLKTVTLF